MKKRNLTRLKNISALAVAIMLTAGLFSDSFSKIARGTELSAEELSEVEADGQSSGENEYDEYNEYSDYSEDYSNEVEQEDSSSEETTSPTSQSYDVTEYAERLKEISEKQAELDEQIESAQDGIEAEAEKQQAILEKIKSVNEKIEVLNSYMTDLEIEISTNTKNLEEKKQEIDDGISDFKKRLRALYLAGDEGYTSVLLNAEDFFDVLMRMELITRVADHDNTLIDNLVQLKNEYEAQQEELEAKQAEYDTQYEELTSQKEVLDELYNSSKEVKEQLEQEREELEAQNQKYLEERQQFETSLSDILKTSYGNSSDETMREAAELAANSALESLYKYYSDLEEAGGEIGEDECTYNFSWPVPGNYYISSGVGERWGSYHTGLDITGSHGTEIHASESGTVLKINTTCTHDYGKTESCGCGGGYGNYIIIDHGNDFITLYGHLTEVDVEVGDTVKQGDVIGKMGSTGYSTGNHLHFEIRYQGYFLNPASYVTLN